MELSRGLGQLVIGQNVDVWDQMTKRWINGEVQGIGRDEVFIHYSGWSAKYDEVIKLASGRMLLQWEPPAPITLNNRLDAHHPIGGWLEARVIEIDQTNPHSVLVHFNRYHPKYDIWRKLDSPHETALIGAKSQAYGIGKKRTKNQGASGLQNARQVLNKLLSRYISILQAGLLERRLAMINIVGDGNCLFRAVSHQLYGVQDHHAAIRNLCMLYIQHERIFFEEFVAENFDEYVKRKASDGEWGDDLQIQALSEIYRRPIEIYALSKNPLRTFHEENKNNVLPIRLAYVGGSHFNSIVPLEIPNARLVTTPFGEIELQVRQLLESPWHHQADHTRQHFSNTSCLMDTVQEQLEAQTRETIPQEDQGIQEFTLALEIAENESILTEIEDLQMKEIKKKIESERLAEELRQLEERQLEEVRRLSKAQSVPVVAERPYWFNDLRNMGYSESEIEFAIEIRGYDPDAVHNFLLDNMCQ